MTQLPPSSIGNACIAVYSVLKELRCGMYSVCSYFCSLLNMKYMKKHATSHWSSQDRLKLLGGKLVLARKKILVTKTKFSFSVLGIFSDHLHHVLHRRRDGIRVPIPGIFLFTSSFIMNLSGKVIPKFVTKKQNYE